MWGEGELLVVPSAILIARQERKWGVPSHTHTDTRAFQGGSAFRCGLRVAVVAVVVACTMIDLFI